ncbi:hypothetical protein HanRHA438_Chr13g0581501 [Helianthus annuus]|nr:hypothetical protein HanRHA438_Chr13g0581501 [Helianthus annuus]
MAYFITSGSSTFYRTSNGLEILHDALKVSSQLWLFVSDQLLSIYKVNGYKCFNLQFILMMVFYSWPLKHISCHVLIDK